MILHVFWLVEALFFVGLLSGILLEWRGFCETQKICSPGATSDDLRHLETFEDGLSSCGTAVSYADGVACAGHFTEFS